MGSPPLLSNKDLTEPSLFQPAALLREARRQKRLAPAEVPAACILDPDGDVVRRLRQTGAARRFEPWPCYHTELDVFPLASGCRLLINLTSAGQIVAAGAPPYFVVIDRALRDEGTSYHYAPPADFAEADPALVRQALDALAKRGLPARAGASWTTDAPFRETAGAIEAARARGILAVEMEAAALYAFARARAARVLCIAHVTNTMGRTEGDFEKGEADGAADALAVLEAVIGALG